MAYYQSMSGAEEFMTNWKSKFFRDRIVAQIEGARRRSHPNPESMDQMEKFLAQNTSQQLEEFVYEKSHSREDYLSLTADVLMHMRQCVNDFESNPESYSEEQFSERNRSSLTEVNEEVHEEEEQTKKEVVTNGGLANGEQQEEKKS